MEGHTGAAAAGKVVERSVTSSLVAISLSVSWCLSFRDHQLYGYHQRCRAYRRSGSRFVLDGMPGKQMAIDADLNPD